MAYSSSPKTGSSKFKWPLFLKSVLLGMVEGQGALQWEAVSQPWVEGRSAEDCGLALACLQPGRQ